MSLRELPLKEPLVPSSIFYGKSTGIAAQLKLLTLYEEPGHEQTHTEP
jgi:hypothetical protein